MRRGKYHKMVILAMCAIFVFAVLMDTVIDKLSDIIKELRRANDIQERNQKQQHEKD